MVSRRSLTVVLAVTASIAALFVLSEGWQWQQTKRYNQAIVDGRYDLAEAHLGDLGLFASAYGEQRDGEIQEARLKYAKLEKSEDFSIRQSASYNLGNSYLSQALTVDIERDPDLALPLIELAKASYRDVLRGDPSHWNAKYNLERALTLSPDMGNERLLELEGLRGTVRSVIATDPEGGLP